MHTRMSFSFIPLHPLIERNRNIRQAMYCWVAVARRTRAASRLLRERAQALTVRSQRLMQSCPRVAP